MQISIWDFVCVCIYLYIYTHTYKKKKAFFCGVVESVYFSIFFFGRCSYELYSAIRWLMSWK